MMKKEYQDYCVGCGLCAALNKANLVEDSRGFLYPENGDDSFLKEVCPVSGKHLANMKKKSVWGEMIKAYLGWSSDEETRKRASSGGILTEIAKFLLQESLVDGIIQTGVSVDCPTETSVYIHVDKKSVEACCGSRYTISHPLELIDKLDEKKRYAFIGKPCDIVVLRNYSMLEPDIKKQIPYMLSFFCAGLPSADAQSALLQHLNCKDKKIVSLQYRGNGWPGETTAIDEMGNKYCTDYQTAWGRILGRDLMRMCRVCIDGIGEQADIACGDAWYLKEDGKPDFSEHKGRNVILVRSQLGMEIWEKMVEKGLVQCEEFQDYEAKLIQMQPYQYKRKVTMLAKIMALRSQKSSYPHYDFKQMIGYAKKGKLRTHLDVYKGTVTRIKEKHF